MNELEQKAVIFGTIFALSNRLQVLGDEFDRNVTIKQWLLLVCISKFAEPPTISEAAALIGYSRQNAKRTADALQKRGFVSIERDKTDARAQRIRLTPGCREYFDRRNPREIEFLERLFAGFDAELTSGFYEGIVRLEQNTKTLLSLDSIRFTGDETT